jgi:hypothetical protein
MRSFKTLHRIMVHSHFGAGSLGKLGYELQSIVTRIGKKANNNESCF